MATTRNIFDAAVVTAPPVPTQEQLKQNAENNIVAQLASGYNALRSVYSNSINFVWRNPDGLTAKQVFNQLDIAGLSLVQYAQKVIEILELAHPGSTKDLGGVPSGWSLDPEMEADGKTPTGRMIVTEPL